MSRSGYSDDCEEGIGLWRGAVKRAIQGKRGQAFLRELAEAMDAMPQKKLIKDALVADGCFCTLGVVGAARGIDMSGIDYECAESVGKVFGISRAMAAEIEFMNDEYGDYMFPYDEQESDEDRWLRMRAWVDEHIVAAPAEEGAA
jgi:hypothetical protein